MDDTQPMALAVSGTARTDVRVDDDVEGAVRWLTERYTMSDSSARILLGQLARQDGVTEAAAARSLAAAALFEV